MNRHGKRIVGGVIGVSAMVLGGCSSVSKTKYDEAVAENLDLRDRVASLQTDLETSETQKQELATRVSDLTAQISSAPAGGSDTGFTGTSGRGGDVVLTVAGDVLFNSGQATLRDEGKRQLDGVAQQINGQYAGNTVRVEGYTDTDPIRKSKFKSNEHLSAERALAVEQYLVSRGVSNSRIYSAAMGPANPKSSKKDSRRVEIVILAN